MSQRPRLEAVLFDAGGTLIRLDFEWMAADLTGHGVAMDAGTLRLAETDGRRAYDASADFTLPRLDRSAPRLRGDVREYFGGTLRAAGVPDVEVANAVVRCLERERVRGLWCRPMEGARSAIDRVRELGLRTAVVSNSDGRAAAHLENAGMLDGIEFVIDSHEVGVEKPDPAIFDHALRRLGTARGRTLFVGDIRSVDEAGAHDAGMPFVLLDAAGDYAPFGTHRIPGMAALADWICAHFEILRSGAGAGREPDPRAAGAE